MPDIAAWKIIDSDTRIQELSLDPLPDSMNTASRQLPGGVYTTLRTFGGGRLLPLEDHFRRLVESARLAGNLLRLDESRVRLALAEALRRFSSGEARLRIQVDLERCPGEVYMILEPLRIPSPEEYAHGVRALTVSLQRENPGSKQVSFIEVAESVRRRLPPGVNEALLVGEGSRILEGLSSNFFAVKEGVIWTAEEDVLPGITRSLVIEAARKLGLAVRLECVRLLELPLLEEAYLTSSSRSVLPVRQINEIVIGQGEPGAITKRLMEAYQAEIVKRLEEVSLPAKG
jgi:branched-chain amino acid aminotransferase